MYMAISHSIGIELRHGFLFRPTNTQWSIIDKTFEYSTADSGLHHYLKQGKLDEGETLQSFRSGCALTFKFSGSSLADIMTHMGWKNSATASII